MGADRRRSVGFPPASATPRDSAAAAISTYPKRQVAAITVVASMADESSSSRAGTNASKKKPIKP